MKLKSKRRSNGFQRRHSGRGGRNGLRMLEGLESRLLFSGSAIPAVRVITADVTVNAGAQAQYVWVPVTLSRAAATPVTVSYATLNITAAAGVDYAANAGTLTFAAGQRFSGMQVFVAKDIPGEADKAFDVVLTGASHASLITAPAGVEYSRVAIHNALATGVARPTLTVANATANAGGLEVFNLNLSAATTRAMTLRYHTSDMTATGADYTPIDGILTIPAGQTSAKIGVRTNAGNATTNTNFALVLTSPSNVTVPNNVAYATIVNYAPPSISIGSANVTEVSGNVGNETMAFTVSLSNPVTRMVTVDYATSNGNAVAGTDYTATSGTLTFNPGDTAKTFNVTITNDSVAPGETFNVILSAATNATIAAATGVGTINFATAAVLSDNLPATTGGNWTPLVGTEPSGESFTTGSSSVELSSVTLALREIGASTAMVQIYDDSGGHPGSVVGTLTSPGSYSAGGFGDATFRARGITLNANSTYWAVLTVTSGEIVWSVTAATTGAGSGFTGAWMVSSNSGATWMPELVDPPQMQVVVGSAVDRPAVSIAPTSVSEVVGDGTTPTMTYTVTLDQAASFPITVHYATSDGTAAAGTDYTATSGTLTFNPGDTTKTINVTVLGDSAAADETLTMTLSSPTNATIATATGTGTITYGGTDVSDNLAGTAFGEASLFTTDMPAASFTTGSSSMLLTSVKVPLQMYSAGTATLQIYTDSSGQPGTAIGTLTSPGSYSSVDHALTTFGGNGITLNANSTYWVVMTAASGQFGELLVRPGTGIGTGFTDTGMDSPDSGSTWTPLSIAIPEMQVLAKPLTDLSDNLSASIGPGQVLTPGTHFASSFSTGTSSVSWIAVTLQMDKLSTPSAPTITINSDSSGNPGSVVATLSSPTVSSNSYVATTSTGSGFTLAANTTYWVVISGTTLGLAASNDTSNGTGVGFNSTGMDVNGGSSWFLVTAYRLPMQVLVSA